MSDMSSNDLRSTGDPEKDRKLAALQAHRELVATGFAGVKSIGGVIRTVDRRIHRDAIPMTKNSMFDIPDPKPLPPLDESPTT